MGTRLRLYEPGLTYNSVSRTVDRTFLFKPNHRKDNILLAEGCPANALDMRNRIVPVPSIINIIGSSVGRALANNPIELNWFEGHVSHNHHGSTCTEEFVDNIAGFFRHANSLIARQVNKAWEREGPVFTGPYRIEPCLDDESAEQKLIYAMTNPVKDGLCETVSQSPFFSTYRHLAFGEPLEFWWIDWAGYYEAGGKANKKHHPKDYLNWIEWSLTPLPDWKNLTIHQRQTRFRKLVQEEEEKQKALRRDENRTRRELGQPERKVYSLPALFALDPRDRPKNPKASGSQPLCHSQNRDLRRAYIEQWREFVKEHRKASVDFRDGMWEREFPQGSYRPPITKIYYSSST